MSPHGDPGLGPPPQSSEEALGFFRKEALGPSGFGLGWHFPRAASPLGQGTCALLILPFLGIFTVSGLGLS